MINDIDLENINTPVYIFDEDVIIANYDSIKSKLSDYEIFYALKANSENVVLNALKTINANFEVASVNEYLRLKEIGVASEKIICSAPIKTSKMVKTLYEGGCSYFVYDTKNQLQMLEENAPDSKKIARISVADIDNKEIEFGMSVEELKDISSIDGITFYMRNHDLNKLHAIFNIIFKILEVCNCSSTFYLNIGGGYGMHLQDEFYNELHLLTCDLKNRHNWIEFSLFSEPGEKIVKNAGYILSKVIEIKKKNDISYVYIDAGIATGIFKYKGVVSVLGSQCVSSSRNIYAFYDISCTHKRLFVNSLKENIGIGNYIVMNNCGAYMSCFINNFHLFNEPEILTVDGLCHE